MPEENENQNKIKPETLFRPSKKELDLISKIYQKYVRWATVINSPLDQFRGLTLENYLKLSRQLFWSKTSLRTILSEDIFRAEFDLFLPEIRNNVLDIVSYLVSLRVKPSFNITFKKLQEMYQSKVLEAIYTNWRNVSTDKIEKFWDFLYILINGSLIKYVGWEETDKERLYFIPSKGKLKPKKQKYYKGEVVSQRVPLENVYIPKIWEPDIKKQGELIVIDRITEAEFKEQYGHYEKSRYVYPGAMLHTESLYFKLLPSVTTTDLVEIVKYYSVLQDQFVILANGIWLNPLNREEDVFPLPYNHKELPFVKTIFEPIDDKFFYGLSLPFKLKSPQEIYNVMTQLLILREMKEISPPILTSDFEKPKLRFGPSEVIPVGDITAYKEMSIAPASGSFFSALTMIKGTLQPQAPVAPIIGRQPRSATEKQLEAYRRTQFYNNYVLMIWNLFYQEVILVIKTALQFYPVKKIKKTLPTGIEKDIYRLIQIENATLPQGGIGNLEVRIVEEPSYWQELSLEVLTRSKISRKALDIIEITPEELQDLDFVITNIQMETENPPVLEQALFKEKVAFITQLFGGMLSPEKAALRTFEVLRESPADWLRDDVLTRLYGIIGEEAAPLTAPLGTPDMMALPQTQNLLQTLRGMQFGAEARTGREIPPEETIPREEALPKFGTPEGGAPPLEELAEETPTI